MRKYIRHPAEIPIEMVPANQTTLEVHMSKDIGLGGLSFKSLSSVEKGTIVNLSIPSINPESQIQGKVVWCMEHRDSVDIGIQFTDQSNAYNAKIVEQLCHIKHYQKKIKQIEGRELTDEGAAREWHEKFSTDF